MFLNYIKTAIRNLLTQRFYTLINIIGLSIGLVCTVLILRYVQYEMSYDRFHSKSERIYRVNFDFETADNRDATALSPWAPAPTLKSDFPDEVEEATHFSVSTNLLASYEDKRTRVGSFCVADTNFFRIFDHNLEIGDTRTALSRPFTGVITRKLAVQLFGEEDPIGKSIKLNNNNEYEITGILSEFSEPSQLEFQLIISLAGGEPPEGVNQWFAIGMYTYILLAEGVDAELFEERLPGLIETHVGESMRSIGMYIYAHLQPLSETHFSNLLGELPHSSNLDQVYIFLAIAFIVLLIACINFINLTTARLTYRAAEVGIRKTFGAGKWQLILQFMLESMLVTTVAFCVAIALMELLSPVFNRLSELDLSIDLFNNGALLAGFAGLYGIVILVTGFIPALVFSSFMPVNVLKGQIRGGTIGRTLRKGLIVLQFTISVILIIGTVIIFHQVNHLRNQKLGFEKENVICMEVTDRQVRAEMELIKEKLVQHSGIVSVSASSGIPGRGFPRRLLMPEGFRDDQVQEGTLLTVDCDFLKTMGLELASGRFYNPEMPSDSVNWLINESMADKLGWDEPVGKGFDFPPRGAAPGEVIGVVKDFNFQSLHGKIGPMAIHRFAMPYVYLSVRIDGEDIEGILAYMEEVWREFAPDWPFEYFFLDVDFNRAYRAQMRFGELFGTFAILSIAIACLGLLGLAAYTTSQRTREIGIRKTLGSRTTGIVMLLSREFLWLVIISNLIAWPAAYLLVKDWLQDFAYRTSIDPKVFITVGIISILFTIMMVSLQSIRAANTNPVEALKRE